MIFVVSEDLAKIEKFEAKSFIALRVVDGGDILEWLGEDPDYFRHLKTM